MKKLTTIEKLNLKYFEYTGNSPAYSFWSWLDAMGIRSDEDELLGLLNDNEYWDNL